MSVQLDDAFVSDLHTFVRDEVSQADEPVERDTDLLLSGAVDSMGVVEIVEWIEQRLAIEIDPGDVVLEHFETVDAMVGYLHARPG
ncbi:MAG: acyl carrier protein [Actinomycetota bacterium]